MTMTNPLALTVEAKRLAVALGSVLDALLAQIEAPKSALPRGNLLKRPDGRLDEDGIDALYADFVQNRLNNRQLAAKHKISLSGVVKRKAMWRRGVR